MKRAATGEYNPAPAGVGTAWSHNFLNQSVAPALLGPWLILFLAALLCFAHLCRG